MVMGGSCGGTTGGWHLRLATAKVSFPRRPRRFRVARPLGESREQTSASVLFQFGAHSGLLGAYPSNNRFQARWSSAVGLGLGLSAPFASRG